MNDSGKINKLKQEAQIVLNLFNTKRYDDVILKTIPLIKKNPRIILFYNVLSLAHNAINEYEKAIIVLEKAIKIEAKNIFVLNNLGLVHSNLENYEEAQKYLNRALSIKSDFLDASITLANLKLKLNNPKETLEILNNVLVKNENNYVLNFTLGNAYQQNGNFEKAISYYNKCLEIEPTEAAADKSISLITKYTNENEHLKKMKLKNETMLSIDNKIFLSFALGKAYEDLKEYKKSFIFLKKGNDLKFQNINFSLKNDLNFYDNIQKIITINNLRFAEPAKKKLIFIVGMPRSGTSLIEQIISAHKKVYGAGELNYVFEIIEKNFFSKDKNFNFEELKKLSKNDLKVIQNSYLKKIERFNSNEDYFIDKAPLNFKWVGLLLQIFPDCKIIHCKRNKMDICWSNYKNLFVSNRMHYSYNLETLGQYYNLYENLMSHWTKIFDKKIYNIFYEELIENKEKEIKKILEFCDLEWDENCLNFYNNKKNVSTASLAQVRQPIYKSSVEMWKNYSEELEDLTKILNI